MPEDKGGEFPLSGSGNGPESGVAEGLKLAAGMKEDPDFKVIREQIRKSSLKTNPHFLEYTKTQMKIRQ